MIFYHYLWQSQSKEQFSPLRLEQVTKMITCINRNAARRIVTINGK